MPIISGEIGEDMAYYLVEVRADSFGGEPGVLMKVDTGGTKRRQQTSRSSPLIVCACGPPADSSFR